MAHPPQIPCDALRAGNASLRYHLQVQHGHKAGEGRRNQIRCGGNIIQFARGASGRHDGPDQKYGGRGERKYTAVSMS